MSNAQHDTPPPADRHAQVEAALDARVLAALAAAWKMATERHLVAGVYFDRADVRRIAANVAEPVTDGEAADTIAGLNDSGAMSAPCEAEVLDHVWRVIAS